MNGTALHLTQFTGQGKKTGDAIIPAATPGSGDGASQERASRNILIVEDEHLVALDMEAALTDAGFAVAGIAASAAEAVSLARSTSPDLVIMDIRLAGDGDGVDAALELFRENGIRCVFATAHHDQKTQSRAQPARPLGWLAKPYQPDALIRAVRDALSMLDGDNG